MIVLTRTPDLGNANEGSLFKQRARHFGITKCFFNCTVYGSRIGCQSEMIIKRSVGGTTSDRYIKAIAGRKEQNNADSIDYRRQ